MFSKYLDQFHSILKASAITNNVGESVAFDNGVHQIVGILQAAQPSGCVYLVGNGGSSGIVSHCTVDLVNACGLRSQALTDNSMLTCMANDYGYENVFSQPLKVLFQESDVLIAVSSSGNSENIVNAAKLCIDKGGRVITLSGFKEQNKLRACGDLNIWVNSDHYGVVEIGHSIILHHITDIISNQSI